MTQLEDRGLPKHTTPTWEVELLISGVAVFAMLQLPGKLDDAIFAVRPRFTADWAGMLAIVYIYAKSAAVLLATTFVAHLVLRARWIAMVGMHSIHPAGIDWDRLRIGPNARRIEQDRFGDIPAAIERADNRATTVFAIGVTLAFVLVTVTLVVAVLLGLALATGITPRPNLLLAAVACVVAPYGMAQVIDRRWGAGLPPQGAASRALRALLRMYGAIGMGNARNVVMALVASHGGRARLVATTSIIMMLVSTSVGLAYFAMKQPGAFGSFGAFPVHGQTDPPTVGAAHYADRRDPSREGDEPYIPSLVARDAYLEVVVPYRPAEDEPAMRQRCPGIAAATSTRSRLAASYACLQRIHALRIDGREVAAPFETSTDPGTGRPALLAMLDVRALPPGRHELRTARLDAHDGEPGEYVIPFWR